MNSTENFEIFIRNQSQQLLEWRKMLEMAMVDAAQNAFVPLPSLLRCHEQQWEKMGKA